MIMRIHKFILFGAVIVAAAIGAFGTLTDSAHAFPEVPGSPRPAQSLGFDVGNLPPNGLPNAKVRIIEYGNYYDPFSRMFFQNIERRLRTEYIETGKVVMYWKDFVFPDFPGLLGDSSAANAARCANEQRMFWQYHDLLLAPQIDLHGQAEQPDLEQLDFKGFGEQLGLDMTRFGRCLDTERYQLFVEANSQDAVRERIAGVPAFFINGRLVLGLQSWDEFKRIIEEELAK